MQIKRLLDDREVFAGDRLFDAQGRSFRSLVHDASEILGRALGLISGGMVGREAVKLEQRA